MLMFHENRDKLHFHKGHWSWMFLHQMVWKDKTSTYDEWKGCACYESPNEWEVPLMIQLLKRSTPFAFGLANVWVCFVRVRSQILNRFPLVGFGLGNCVKAVLKRLGEYSNWTVNFIDQWTYDYQFPRVLNGNESSKLLVNSYVWYCFLHALPHNLRTLSCMSSTQHVSYVYTQ